MECVVDDADALVQREGKRTIQCRPFHCGDRHPLDNEDVAGDQRRTVGVHSGIAPAPGRRGHMDGAQAVAKDGQAMQDGGAGVAEGGVRSACQGRSGVEDVALLRQIWHVEGIHAAANGDELAGLSAIRGCLRPSADARRGC